MDFLELVKARYSVRHYSSRPVEQEKIDYLLECARLAPSACNRQPWHLFVVREKGQREALCAAASRFEWLKEAPLLIAVCVDDAQAWTRSKDGHCHADIDAAILTEHLSLAATAQGLGSCWICAFDPELCRKALHLAEELRPVALLPIGYAEDQIGAKSRKPLEEIRTEIL
uniref:nitroreductase family protein n=1 Tax=Alistipes sp. TaxID=1872444 RepID=UPI004056BCCB